MHIRIIKEKGKKKKILSMVGSPGEKAAIACATRPGEPSPIS
jgi:hypothetical protein